MDIQEKLNRLSPDEKEEIANWLEAEIESKTTHSQFKKHTEILKSYGYTMHSHSTDHRSGYFSKNLLNDDEPTLHVRLERRNSDDGWVAEVSHQIRTAKISSSQFAFPHDRFIDLFEKEVLEAANRVKDMHPERIRV